MSNSSKNYTREGIIEKERQEAQLDKFSKIGTEPPHFLDEIAKRGYLRVLPHMRELSISNLDEAQLVQYCSFYSDFVKTSLILGREGLILKDDKGSQKVSPALSIREEASTRLQQTASTLGLTIDSRSRITAPDEEEDDDPYMKFVSN